MPKKLGKSHQLEGQPNKEKHKNVFPWEEELRGRSRAGKFKLPEPQFVQPPDVRDRGDRLTPNYFSELHTRRGDLKFEEDLGFGDY